METTILIALAFVLLRFSGPTWILLCELFSKPDPQRDESPPEVLEAAKGEMNGCRALVTSPLKPAGMVKVNGTYYDAVSQFGFVNVGEEVEIVSKKDSRLVVRRRRNPSA